MEYTEENISYTKEVSLRCDTQARKFRKSWVLVAKVTSGNYVFFEHIYTRYDWKWSDKPTYGIPDVDWSIGEVLTKEEMMLRKLQDETVEMIDENN